MRIHDTEHRLTQAKKKKKIIIMIIMIKEKLVATKRAARLLKGSTRFCMNLSDVIKCQIIKCLLIHRLLVNGTNNLSRQLG